MGELQPLTDDEAALIAHVERWGSDGYPIEKIGKSWQIVAFRSWPGYPTTYETKKAAAEQFRRWLSLALERWAAMKREHPDAIMTAVGIRGLRPTEADPEVYACPDGATCTDPECRAENARRAGLYAVKCDDCKAELRKTDSVSESAAGGLCDPCREESRRRGGRAMEAATA